VIVGGLDGDARSAQAVIEAVRWMKRGAPQKIRDRWIVSALPMADPDGQARAKPFHFPPAKGFYEDPEQPESRYVWRWVTYQAPDLVVEFRGEAAATEPPDSLTAALRDPGVAGLGMTATLALPASASHDDLRPLSRAWSCKCRCTMPSRGGSRVRRWPSRSCSRGGIRPRRRSATSRRSRGSRRSSCQRAPARRRCARKCWRRSSRGFQARSRCSAIAFQLTTVAGTMVFAELAQADPANAAARRLALEGAEAALKEKDGGVPQYGQGWTDDMFMTAAILARTGSMRIAHEISTAPRSC